MLTPDRLLAPAAGMRGRPWAVLWGAVALLGAHYSGRAAAEPNPRGDLSPGEASAPSAPLPPPDVRALSPGAPSPQWGLGLLLGVCGTGQESFWQGTDFCGGLLGDVHFFRRVPRALGLGAYGALETSGFFDFRGSAGVFGLLPLSELLVLQAGAGPLLLSASDGVSGGVDVRLDFGLRGLSPRGHYSMAHTLSLGLQHVPGSLSRAGTTMLVRIRLDAFWLALPVTLFR